MSFDFNSHMTFDFFTDLDGFRRRRSSSVHLLWWCVQGGQKLDDHQSLSWCSPRRIKFIMMFTTKENEGGKIDETSEVTRTERSGKLLDAEEAALGKHKKKDGTVSRQFAFWQNNPSLQVLEAPWSVSAASTVLRVELTTSGPRVEPSLQNQLGSSTWCNKFFYNIALLFQFVKKYFCNRCTMLMLPVLWFTRFRIHQR